MKQKLKLQLFVALCCIVLLRVPANAVDPDRRISQYGHTAWLTKDGGLRGVPAAITQTADGYVWIGTDQGLLRFDGIRFVPWTAPAGKQLPYPNISALLSAKDGSLWIGSDYGLSHWVNRGLTNYTKELGIIQDILEDRSGTIWVARSPNSDQSDVLCRVAGLDLQCYGKSSGLPDWALSYSLIEDGTGSLWLGGDTGVVRWKQGSVTFYGLKGLKSNYDFLGVQALAPSPDGSLWAGSQWTGPGLGLQQLVQGVWKPFITPELNSSTLEVTSLFLDAHNSLWIGTTNNGIYRIHGNAVDHFRKVDGLSGDYVRKFYQDREENLWVVTSEGIDCFHDTPVAGFSSREGLGGQGVEGVFASKDGTVWIAQALALDALRQNRITSLRTGKGLPGTLVTSLFEDHSGQLWVGIDKTIAIYKNGNFRRIHRPDGSQIGLIVGITEDIDGNLWILASGNPKVPRALIRIRDDKVQEIIPVPQIPPARRIAADPRGGIWLGLMDGNLARYWQGRTEVFHFPHTLESFVDQVAVRPDGSVLGATASGLIGWKEGTQRVLTSRNGLPCDSVHTFISDDKGDLWLYTQCGLVEITNAELQQWWEHPDATVKLRVFDVFDGVRTEIVPFQGAAKTPDGRLWFVNKSTLQMIDPAKVARNAVQPPVNIEEVVADRKSYSPVNGLRLPPLTRDIEIDYTALSFGVPQKVRFRYRLEGHDSDWQDPHTRRQAFYSDLRPGQYRFRVIACNNDGVWNETGATLNFNVAPAWYQTIWFRAAWIAAGLSGLYLLYLLRLRQVTRRVQVRMAERFDERERIARDLHDTLLQSVQGLILKFHALTRQVPVAEVRQNMDQALDHADLVLTEGRDRVRSLRGTTEALSDLPAAFQRVAKEALSEGVASVRVVVEGNVRQLNPLVLDESFSIGREALINALRHSGGLLVEVEIAYGPKQFRLRVRDDGHGIDPAVLEQGGRPDHWGLPGMRERARRIGAHLQLWSRPGAGTEVELTVPGTTAYRFVRTKTGKFWFGRVSRIDQ